MRILIFILLIGVLGHSQDNASLNYYLPTQVTYNPNISTPDEVIGHAVGEWHISHDKLVQYMYQLAKESDRISIENRGQTFEGRPILLLTVTSANNHTNIESIKNAHIEATNTTKTNSTSRPIVVYQGFSIHGNEPSGSNAALLLAYYLAAAESTEINKLLQNTIILLDPSFNPDGLQRFAHWANSNKNTHLLVSDNQDREFHEDWPGGRTNHYWFDMNRDWLPVQLPESRARIKTFHHWMPNILTDHHEMGTNATFFFQPGIPSRTHPLTPKMNQKLTEEIAKFHAKALDQVGSLYYSEENFDDFYYGKGSTFPDINGSIGILFEQASSRGHLQESDNGLVHFPFTIKNQFLTALSTLEAAKNLKSDILNYQSSFYKNSRNESQNKKGAYVFGDSKDSSRSQLLAEILERHQIKILKPTQDLKIDGISFPQNNTYIIPKNQKKSRLIQAMFEKRTTFTDSLFYDISAWSFPLAFNLLFTEIKHIPKGNSVTKLKKIKGKVSGKSNYGYLFEWHAYYSPKLLYKILKNGIRAKVGLKKFASHSKEYDYGTILIPVQNQKLNSDKLYAFLSSAVEDSEITIEPVHTGIMKGIDLGSNSFRTLELPKIGLFVGAGINPYDAGEIWHLMDTRYQIPITRLDINKLNRLNLDKYNTLLLPNYSGKIDERMTKKLKVWVQNGGTLIGFRNSVKKLNDIELLNSTFKKSELTAQNISFEERSDFFGAQYIGGAIFEAKIDRSHPINFGYSQNKVSLFRNTTLFIEPHKQSYNNPIQYTQSPLLSGYISKPNLDSLKNSVPLVIKRTGQGKVVGFTDNPNFRAFWYGTNKLMMNAIIFRENY